MHAHFMSIVMVGEYYKPNLIGGGEVQAMRRAEGLANMGLKVLVVSFDSNRGTIEETINGVKIVRYHLQSHKGKMLSMLLPVAKALMKHEKDTEIYHVYNIFPLAGGGLYKLMGGRKPVVASLDHFGGYCPISMGTCEPCNLINRYSCLKDDARSIAEKLACFPYASIFPLLTFLTKQVDKYIAVSEFVKQEYIKYGYNSHKLVVLPNSIDIGSWQGAIKKPHSGINLIYVGRMTWDKCVDVLIKAFEKISNKYPQAKLILIGDGPLFEAHRSLVKQLHLESKVVFTGYLKHDGIKHYYSIADLFVYPTIGEAFGISLLEAMAYDLPAVVSDHAALKDVVKDAGITFRLGQVEDLAAKISLLIDDPNKLLALQKRCKHVLNEYADAKVLKDLVNIYEGMQQTPYIGDA
jgi:glycosyltransferase involved in cell wall biosynthesis